MTWSRRGCCGGGHAVEIALGFRMRRRWLMLVLGVVNILLALFVPGSVPISAPTLPRFMLGVSSRLAE